MKLKNIALLGLLCISSLASAATVDIKSALGYVDLSQNGVNTVVANGQGQTRYYELVLGAYDKDVTFSLTDTNPDARTATLSLYADTNTTIGKASYDDTKALFTGTLTDLVNSSLSSTLYASLKASMQYLFKVTLTTGTTQGTVNISAVPLPGAVWLFGSALLGFLGFSNRRKI